VYLLNESKMRDASNTRWLRYDIVRVRPSTKCMDDMADARKRRENRDREPLSKR
jgi:hypothetical protein